MADVNKEASDSSESVHNSDVSNELGSDGAFGLLTSTVASSSILSNNETISYGNFFKKIAGKMRDTSNILKFHFRWKYHTR